MITCGKTVLVNAVPEILSILGKDRVALVFYERKNFMFPGDQPSNFEDDVARLVTFFKGKSYRLGPANHDHVHVFFSSHYSITPKQDVTLQVLMNDLDPDASAMFCCGSGRQGADICETSGLSRLYENMKLDSHLFLPYGFSLNGIRDADYFTVHVTPQSIGSYASFETNVVESDYASTIQRVISIFRPKKFSLVLTTSMDPDSIALHPAVVEAVDNYLISEKSLYEFDCGYAVTFLNHVLK
jgi:S-adenosylmethionine decarboxylase